MPVGLYCRPAMNPGMIGQDCWWQQAGWLFFFGKKMMQVFGGSNFKTKGWGWQNSRWCDFGGGKRGVTVMGRSWPSCGEVRPASGVLCKKWHWVWHLANVLQETATEEESGKYVWNMRVRFSMLKRPKIAVTLDSRLVRLSHWTIPVCQAFFLAMITSLGVSISPRHFPFLWTKDHPAFLRNLHRLFLLSSVENLGKDWVGKVCELSGKLESWIKLSGWDVILNHPSNRKKKRGFKFKLQVFWICLEKIPGKNSWIFFLSCFLNIWKNKDGGGQCFGEKISSFHRRRDCTIAALKSEKAVSGTQQKIDVAYTPKV